VVHHFVHLVGIGHKGPIDLCTRRSFAAATIFMADVILRVFLTDAILSFISFSDAIE
jgi:hypothetical protein